MGYQLVQDVGEFIPDKLIAGSEKEILTKVVKLKKGQGILKRGTVVGKITSIGLFVTVDSSQSDGSQVPYGILTDDVNTADEDIGATVYISGIFNQEALIFGASDTYSTYEGVLREKGIILREVI